ncbi:MAG: ribonuclease P protein component [Aurantimicrobium sp.]|uniref:Ribonuclease P protein component n=1 Tax=Aurantimicrobium photophilum TaxID=1987356 RepID=A0A2Z3S0J2_9MICO|nr:MULTISPECIES: ribonuclease P protein component [Aurantimicrobium]AWR20628.1 Ribonuclease P protein component [Aurantimicrobium photophilum]MDF9809324.1 ribonuclease P protein component [Aurantimicrobium minutum]MDH6207538.1 ribonuclease P protein component [Aurantimicrobium minutum]MDH6254807.1 ribonuclease P protein component [Aurantimicrobium minutum]MDH6409635.1 ribonuclease P protein component [Aurantimicrobium minutum]
MLDRAHRLALPTDFRRITRRGTKQTSSLVVAYAAPSDRGLSRFGIVTSKALGNAPTRNRVRRQLRAIAWEVKDARSADIVIRALPAAATASWEDLHADVLRTLEKLSASS